MSFLENIELYTPICLLAICLLAGAIELIPLHFKSYKRIEFIGRVLSGIGFLLFGILAVLPSYKMVTAVTLADSAVILLGFLIRLLKKS